MSEAPGPGPEVEREAGELFDRLRQGERAALARAITRIESRHAVDDPLALALLRRAASVAGSAHRIGISGVPGVGKSTLLDTLGVQLVETGCRPAILAVDPSSTVTGGSILGDKNRMANLARRPEAFIRPSPTGQTLGGVARRTREAMVLCEAAGFDVLFVETVGVGQSETVVADMVDTFVVLLLPGSGDELQGIKKGILEVADVLAINKADGDNLQRAEQARRDVTSALHYARHRESAWAPEITVLSGATGEGVIQLWEIVERHLETLRETGELEGKRRSQRSRWIRRLAEEAWVERFRTDPATATALEELDARVQAGELSTLEAAQRLLAGAENNGPDS